MWELGLKGILDYSLEDTTNNASYDQNLQGFLDTVQTTLRLPIGLVSFACVKITALCPLPLLERVSDLLRWRHLESALAASLGVPSPIHSFIQDTHRCYDACARFMMEKAAMAEASVVLAIHNLHSSKKHKPLLSIHNLHSAKNNTESVC